MTYGVMRTGSKLFMAALLLSLAACSGGTGDLEDYIETTLAKPGVQRIEPLPKVQPYETFVYEAFDLRSPFLEQTPTAATLGDPDGPRPVVGRSKEYLEQFPLDTLEMVGTLDLSGTVYGLVQTGDGLVHRVVVGNYLGTNDGHITVIDNATIELVEIISDGLGGYIERPASIALID